MKPAPDPSAQDALGELWRSWSALAAAALPGAEALTTLPPAAAAAPIQAVLAQAQVAGAATLLKVWTRSAQSLAEYQREVQRGAGDGDRTPQAAANLAAQVDHARAHLRRLSEIALEEGDALDGQMQALDQQLRALIEEPVAAAPKPRRYARAKP